jgi:hypothetical protein
MVPTLSKEQRQGNKSKEKWFKRNRRKGNRIVEGGYRKEADICS